MYASPVLSPTGDPVFLSHGDGAWKVMAFRGLLVSMEWTELTSARQLVRCMVIKRQRLNAPVLHGETGGAWAIMESAMANFLDAREDGTDEAGFNRFRATGMLTRKARQEVEQALPILGFDRNDRHAATALLDCIERFGPDLFGGRSGMPRFPPKQQHQKLKAPPMWEVTATNKSTGKVVSESEV